MGDSLLIIILLFYKDPQSSSWHLPAVTRTLSTARTSRPLLGPLALIISRNCRSTFLKVTWALTQVSPSGLSCSIVTFPGLPLLGQARMVRLVLLPSVRTSLVSVRH